jgi:PAS domain S-box-containing protein
MAVDRMQGAERAEAPPVDPLRAAVDSLPVLISQVDANERYRFVNQAYSEWFARPADEIVGSTMRDVVGPAAYATMKPWVDAALSGRAVRFETLAPYRDGGARYIDASYTPSFDASGAVDGFFVLVQDVTARKRAEEALALSETQLAAVLESVSDVFYAVDSDGRVILLNAAGERFLGMSRQQVLGRRLPDVFQGLAGSVFQPMVEAAMRGEQPPAVEAASRTRPDRRVLARASPLAGGGMAVAFTDVTERWRAEVAQQTSDRKVREQLEELEAIYESSPVGLAFLTKDLRFVRVNRRLAEMNGVPAADHLGRTVRDVVPAIADQVDAILARLQAGEEIVTYEVSGETPATPGQEGAWLEYWTPLRGAEGEVRGLNVVVEDISERKRAEARAQLLIEELNHRVKNTLAVVQSLARQSFRGDEASVAAREAFEQRLLALAAAHNILTQRRWEAADLREVAVNAIGAEEQRIALDGPEVAVGPDVAVALSLALHELTTNARKYGALSVESGYVELCWTLQPRGRVRVRWREHGGPPVEAPRRRGFGARLLERAMDGVPDGDATLSFPAAGVVCEIGFRAARPATRGRGR